MEKYTKYNCSTYFWLKPITNISLQEHVRYGFLNTYLRFEDLDGLFVEYDNNTNKLEYNKMIVEVVKNPDFMDEYTIGDKFLLHYNINPKWKNDYELFLQGKYSKMSGEYKKLFNQKLPNGLKSLQWKIFDKDEELKKEIEKYTGTEISTDVDYFFLPNLNKETWKI